MIVILGADTLTRDARNFSEYARFMSKAEYAEMLKAQEESDAKYMEFLRAWTADD